VSECVTLVYLAWASRREPVAIGLVVPLLWVINVGVVKREERYLERKFGDAYRAYKARVRRDLMGGFGSPRMEFEATVPAYL